MLGILLLGRMVLLFEISAFAYEKGLRKGTHYLTEDNGCRRRVTPALLEQPVKLDDWRGLNHMAKGAHNLYRVSIVADERS
jgi:hypothetical protein